MRPDSITSPRTEAGAVAIMVALSMLALTVACAMVLSFGAIRVDRQANKSAADSAVLAGLRGLDQGDGKLHPFAGVCQAINYLKTSDPKFSTLTGTWKDGDGNAVAGGCTSGPSGTFSRVCSPAAPGSRASWARFEGTAGSRTQVWIQSGYLLTEGGNFPEESALPALRNDVGKASQRGCDQIAVIVTQRRSPAFGGITGLKDIVSTVRSAGRVFTGEEGKGAVALLLLERNNCGVLNASGSGKILVAGNGTQPGMIHVDSLGNDQVDNNGDGEPDETGLCRTVQVINGGQARSVVAGQSVIPPLKNAIITVRALGSDFGATPSKASDPAPKVVSEPSPPNAPLGRGLVTRDPVDSRWLAGVRAVITSPSNYARSSVALPLDPTPGSAADGVTYVTSCTGAAGPGSEALTQSETVVFNCPDAGSRYPDISLPARRVIFKANVEVSSEFWLPNAEEVYIRGVAGRPALTVGNKASFQMHTSGRTKPSGSLDYPRPVCTDLNIAGRAKLVIGAGGMEATTPEAHMQLCHSTTILMGNQESGCVPSTPGTPPTKNSCDGFISINGGQLDWTAPDAVSVGATQADWDNLEDLAFWTEAEDSLSSTKHRVVGGGILSLAGVFMLPNADDFSVGGNGIQRVENSQYVARRLSVEGTGELKIRPDPADSFVIPFIEGFQLIR